MYRICQITSAAGIGGGELHLLLLARYLHGREFQFDFILPDEGQFCDRLQAAGLPYQVIPMRSKFSLQASKQVWLALAKNPRSIVHCHGARANWYARRAAHETGSGALFCTLHNSLKDYPYSALRRRFYLALERQSAALVDQWIAVSQSLGRDLAEYYGVDEKKIAVVPNGIRIEDMQPQRPRDEIRWELELQPDSFVVLEVARMTDQKGHRFLIDALATARAYIPNLRCLLAGDGPTRTELERQVDALGLRPVVKFLGFRSDVADLLHAADLVVLPSLSEGMPMGILEAMAAGRAVLAAAVSGTPEIVEHGVDGWLIPAADAAALAAALQTLAADAPLRARLGAAARQVVARRFSAERMASSVGELYRAHVV